MARVVFTPNRGAVASLMKSPSGPAFRLVRAVQSETQAIANRATPVDTGRLRGANELTPIVVQGEKVVGGVENKTKYAMFVHEGTKPHVIVPRRRKVLAWVPRGGNTVFARRVEHPGTKAQPWLARSAELAARRRGMRFDRG